MNKKYRIIWLLMLPLLVGGFSTLEEPEFYPDSNGKPSIQQKLDFLGDNKENSPKTEDERFDRSPQSIDSEKTASEPMDLEISPEQAKKYGVQEFSIIATDKGFLPDKIIVRRNIPVNLYLTSTDSKNLCFVMKHEEYGFHKGITAKSVEKIQFNPQKVGPYKFHCPINNIEGTMVVRD